MKDTWVKIDYRMYKIRRTSEPCFNLEKCQHLKERIEKEAENETKKSTESLRKKLRKLDAMEAKTKECFRKEEVLEMFFGNVL